MWFFNRNSVLNFLSHVAIRLLFLVVLSEVPLETNFITKNFATILAGSFLTQVNSPQVCDVDGWMDGWTIGYRVATALRIVYWPSLSILG